MTSNFYVKPKFKIVYQCWFCISLKPISDAYCLVQYTNIIGIIPFNKFLNFILHLVGPSQWQVQRTNRQLVFSIDPLKPLQTTEKTLTIGNLEDFHKSCLPWWHACKGYHAMTKNNHRLKIQIPETTEWPCNASLIRPDPAHRTFW
jgi:hypothetical protein